MLADSGPSVTGKVSIDGYTQPGAVEAPDSSTPAQPQIVIDANRVTRGIRIAGDGSELRGLVVQGADGGAGIFFLADGLQVDGNDNRITGNFIGTDETGPAAVPNIGDGVQVNGDDNVVGGAAAQDRNVISANPDNVHVYSGAGSEILGNLIGTDSTGKQSLGNGSDGIVIQDSGWNTIGGSQAGAGNVVAGNGDEGVRVGARATVRSA